MNVQKPFEKSIEIFVSRVLEQFRDSIERIILFGSVARNEADEDSDVDLLIVTKEKDISLIRGITDISFDVLLEFGCDISPKVYGLEEVEKQSRIQTPFFWTIKNDSVVVYEAS